jgi:rhodanese-related sulfurtransferase
MRSITPEMLKARLDRDDILELIDVRDPWEFDTCHIEGARNIPMMEIESSLQTIDTSVDTVVICHHGMRSQQVVNYLVSLGYQQMINLEGGIHRWAQTVEPDMPQY